MGKKKLGSAPYGFFMLDCIIRTILTSTTNQLHVAFVLLHVVVHAMTNILVLLLQELHVYSCVVGCVVASIHVGVVFTLSLLFLHFLLENVQPTTPTAPMETCVWLEARQILREEWRCALMRTGEASVAMDGQTLTL